MSTSGNRNNEQRHAFHDTTTSSTIHPCRNADIQSLSRTILAGHGLLSSSSARYSYHPRIPGASSLELLRWDTTPVFNSLDWQLQKILLSSVDRLFGVLNIVLGRDPAQLEPVRDRLVYADLVPSRWTRLSFFGVFARWGMMKHRSAFARSSLASRTTRPTKLLGLAASPSALLPAAVRE